AGPRCGTAFFPRRRPPPAAGEGRAAGEKECQGRGSQEASARRPIASADGPRADRKKPKMPGWGLTANLIDGGKMRTSSLVRSCRFVAPCWGSRPWPIATIGRACWPTAAPDLRDRPELLSALRPSRPEILTKELPHEPATPGLSRASYRPA